MGPRSAIHAPTRALAGLAAGLLAAVGCGGTPPLPADVLLVTLDTLRRDHVGLYGGPPDSTPHLDALGRTGLVHDAAYTTMPTTGPAHLSLLTGLYPSRLSSLANGETLLPEWHGRELGARLRDRGFATAAFVAARLLGPGATGLRGFEIYDGPRELLRSGEQVVRSALAWLDVEERRPIFLWVHLYDPHAPYGSALDKRSGLPVDPSRHGWVDPRHYDSREERSDAERLYARGVRDADAALGALLAGVRARLEHPPLVLVAADHGESLAEHLESRGFAYDHGKFLDPECLAIPLVVAGPGVAPGRSAGAVSIRDLYATVLLAAGLDPRGATGSVGDGEADVRDLRRPRGLDPRGATGSVGDGEADVRDLRRPSAATRVVRVERRRLRGEVPDLVRAHAAGATDGRRLLILGEDGRAAPGGVEAADLLAQAQLSLRDGGSDESRPVDPETAEALRQLGYLE